MNFLSSSSISFPRTKKQKVEEKEVLFSKFIHYINTKGKEQIQQDLTKEGNHYFFPFLSSLQPLLNKYDQENYQPLQHLTEYHKVILQSCFSYLPLKDLYTIQACNTKWNSIVDHPFCWKNNTLYLNPKNFENCTKRKSPLTNLQISGYVDSQKLVVFQEVTHLYISLFQFGLSRNEFYNSITSLSLFPKLKKLKIEFNYDFYLKLCKIPFQQWKNTLESITFFNIELDTDTEEETLEQLSSFPLLKEFTLKNYRIPKRNNMTHLFSFKNLKVIHLEEYCSHTYRSFNPFIISSDKQKFISFLQNIKEINLEGIFLYLLETFFTTISSTYSLEKLILIETTSRNLTLEWWNSLPTSPFFKSVKELSLTFAYSCYTTNFISAPFFTAFENLTSFSVDIPKNYYAEQQSNLEFTEEILKQSTNSLTHLSVSNLNIADFQSLQKYSNLVSLELENSSRKWKRNDQENLFEIKCLKNLHSLHLTRYIILENSCSSLRELNCYGNLKELHLMACDINPVEEEKKELEWWNIQSKKGKTNFIFIK